MGYSSINVSLTYLRGLEVPELKEEDMPELKSKPSQSRAVFVKSSQSFFYHHIGLDHRVSVQEVNHLNILFARQSFHYR